MKVFEDKINKKWKIGSNGKSIYNSKKEAERALLDKIVSKLMELNKKRSDILKWIGQTGNLLMNF